MSDRVLLPIKDGRRFWIVVETHPDLAALNEVIVGAGKVCALYLASDEHVTPRKLGTLHLLLESVDLGTLHHECNHVAMEILRRLTGSKVSVFMEHEETAVELSEALFVYLVTKFHPKIVASCL